MQRVGIVFFLLLTQIPTPLYAQSATTLGAVTIIAPRTAADDDRSIAATLITIDDESSRSQSVADILQSAAGVEIKSYGGLDGFAVAMIRGSTPGQVAVYLDGVPLNGATYGQVNLAEISLNQLERIEIYRGFTPPGFARGGIGGVINLVTRQGEGVTAGAGGMAGSFGTYRLQGSGGSDIGEFHLNVRAESGGSRGDYHFPSDNGTPLNSSDDFVDNRKNNRHEFRSGLFTVWGKVNDIDLNISHNFYGRSQGIAGLAANQSESAWFGMNRHSTILQAALPGQFAPALKLISLTEQQEFHDAKGEVGVGNQENFSTLRRFGVETRLNVSDLSATGRAVFFASLYDEAFNEEQRLQRKPHSPERRRRSYTLSGAAEFALAPKVTIHPSLRYEHYDNIFAGDPFFGFGDEVTAGTDAYLSPKIGLAWAVAPGFTLKTNVGRFYRAPDMAELFGDRGIATGNSQLRAEKGINVDMGLLYEGEVAEGALTAEAFLFASRTDDLIAWVRNSQSTSIARNIGKAEIVGLESSFAWRRHGFSFSGNATLQRAIDRSNIPHFNGNALPDRPGVDIGLRVSYHAARFRAFYEVAHTAEVWLDRANFSSVAARTLHSVGLTASNPRYGELTFEIKNLTDDQVSDAIGYPLPGRSYYATYRWQLQ